MLSRDHDFDATDDRGLEARDFRWHRLQVQQTVDAVADAQAAFFRLDVNIAGSFIGRLDEDFVHELDDRRLLGHFGRFAVVGVQAIEQFDILGAALGDHGRDGFAADAEMDLDEASNLARTGQNGMNVQAGQSMAEFIEGRLTS